MENRRRKKSKEPEIDIENEDSWEQELRTRRELAEKAIEYGIERRKERLKNMDPKDISILQRIRQDAEEILRRRAEEQKYADKDKQDLTYPQPKPTYVEREEVIPDIKEMTQSNDEGITVNKDDPDKLEKQEEENNEEKKPKKKKSEKAILKMLDLKPVKQDPKPSESEKPTTTEPPKIETTTTTAASYKDTVLRFQELFSKIKGSVSKKNRKKLKKHKRALKRGKGREKPNRLLENLSLRFSVP
ncbi:hypothetical protein ACOMHN_011146 [Nucella lapillus]